jgi:hypothetical protein
VLDSLKNGLRDAVDILERARPSEVVRALVPARVRGLRILNEGDSPTGMAPRAVAQRLRELRSLLKAEAVDDDGNVSYGALRGSQTYRELEDTARLLSRADLDALDTDASKTAFWINLYNVLAIHGVVALGIEESVMEVPAFFSWVAYRVGQHAFTLDDIENGILRANAPHPVTRRRLLGPRDPRAALAVSRVDPRIHAALVCASTSCPAVRFYEADDLDAQLDVAAAAYVAGAVTVDDDAHSIELPITFRYYEADFEEHGVDGFVLCHADGEHERRLREALAAGYRIVYARYDWSLNGRL